MNKVFAEDTYTKVSLKALFCYCSFFGERSRTPAKGSSSSAADSSRGPSLECVPGVCIPGIPPLQKGELLSHDVRLLAVSYGEHRSVYDRTHRRKVAGERCSNCLPVVCQADSTSGAPQYRVHLPLPVYIYQDRFTSVRLSVVHLSSTPSTSYTPTTMPPGLALRSTTKEH